MDKPYRYSVEEIAPGVTWRDVNAPYPESTGRALPLRWPVVILPVCPYTRLQRALHRLGICRFHTHHVRLDPRGIRWRRFDG